MRIAYVGKEQATQLESEEKLFTFFELPQSLTKFVSLPALKDYDHIVFNLHDTKYSAPHIISAIQILKQYISSEITIVKDDNEETKELFVCLQNFNVKNLIAIKEGEEKNIFAEIDDCISGKKSLEYLAKTKIAGAIAINIKNANLAFTIPKGISINIAVVGALNRIGTTTHAAGIYHYCKSLGFNPLLIDKTGLHLALREYEETMVDEQGFLNMRGIRFDINEHSNDEHVNANIFDCGCDIEHNAADILSADIVVLVCGSKITEILKLSPQLEQLTDIESERRVNIVSFSTHSEFKELSEALNGDSFEAIYHPDMWHENNIFYTHILYQKLKSICQKV